MYSISRGSSAVLQADVPCSIDLAGTYIDICVAYDNVEKWTREQPVDFNLSFFPMRPTMKAEPKGVILIIAAFNVPLFLTLGPLVGLFSFPCTCATVC